LDFHTSEAIPSVGEKFSPAQFQEALKRGAVDSVTIFSKCHHGLSYHDTKIGKRHPGLQFELMPRQIEACRAIDVKCPIYISAGLDEWSARHRPEWLTNGKDGSGPRPLQAGYKRLGFDTPYLDYLCEQIEEVVDNYDAEDGIFLDIIGAVQNFSQLALGAMRAAGVNPEDEEAVTAWSYQVLQNYYARTTAAARKGNPDRRVFHNSGHIPKGAADFFKWNSHLELESLPTGGWGYDHFPISAKYAATTGFDYLGMTGKFHTSWGDFGGFKRPDALRYECAAMISFGAKCSVGDQLHPSGEMNLDTYDLIGAGYREVEIAEPWISGAVPVSEVALVSPEALRAGRFGGHTQTAHAEEGAARMLLELGIQFDVVDLDRNLAPYPVVILPDEIPLEGALAEKITSYLAGGGKLILSGRSGFAPGTDQFAFEWGLNIEGRSPYNPDYLVPTAAAPTPRVRGPFVIHGGTWNLTAGDGWEVLAGRRDPYFNRAWDHFCSHQHTPDAVDSPYPAAVSNGQIAYFAHAIFTSYRQLGQPLYRDLFADALGKLLPVRRVVTSLPTAGRTALTHQAAENRSVLHLLFAVPQKRGANSNSGGGVQAVEIIDDLFPIHQVQVKVRPGHDVTSVTLVPGNKTLEFTEENGTVSFTVPTVECHQMVELA